MTKKPLPAYEGDEPFAFVSYSHEDEASVYPEIQWLQNSSVNVWYDEGISGASRWRDAIAARLTECNVFVFFVSPKAITSQRCREELEFALDLGIPVLSIYLQSVSLPDGIKLALANRQALFKFELTPHEYRRKVLEAIERCLKTFLPRQAEPKRRRFVSRNHRWSLGVVYSVLAVLVITAAVVEVASRFGKAIEIPTTRFVLDVPENIRSPNYPFSPAISRDGTKIALVGRDSSNSSSQLYLRSLNELESAPVQGTQVPIEPQGIRSVFFSPDGRWLAYLVGNTLIKTPVSGGSQVTFFEKDTNAFHVWYGGSWGEGFIVFAGLDYNGLVQVPENGGEPEIIVQGVDGERIVLPHAVPGKKAVLFTRIRGDFNTGESHVVALSMTTGLQKVLVSGSAGQVLPAGYLLFVRDRELWGAQFDLDKLEVVSVPVPLTNNAQLISTGHGYYSIADDGSIIYLTGTYVDAKSMLVWVDQDGNSESLMAAPNQYRHPRLSPDGQQVVVRAEGADLWVYRLDQPKTPLRITFDEKLKAMPVWSPDGGRIAYVTWEQDVANIFIRDSDGTGDAVRLTHGKHASESRIPTQWIENLNALLTYGEQGGIYLIPLDEDSKELTLLSRDGWQADPALSPDRRWLTYVSDESGRREVYVRPFPNVESGRWQVSENGGKNPVWAPDGQALVYWSAEGVVRVHFSSEDSMFRRMSSDVLFPVEDYVGSPGRHHDLSPHEDRILMVKRVSKGRHEVIVVRNWLDELRSMLGDSSN